MKVFVKLSQKSLVDCYVNAMRHTCKQHVHVDFKSVFCKFYVYRKLVPLINYSLFPAGVRYDR